MDAVRAMEEELFWESVAIVDHTDFRSSSRSESAPSTSGRVLSLHSRCLHIMRLNSLVRL